MIEATIQTTTGLDWQEYPERPVPIDRIRPNPNNPWEHPQEQDEAVTQSLDRWGLVGTPVFNENTGHLLDGHLRWRIAVRRGAKALPCRIVDWPEEEEKAFLASFNQTGRMVGVDQAALTRLIEELKEEEGEYPIGWSDEAFQQLLDGFDQAVGRPEVEAPDEFEEVDEDLPTSYCCPRCQYVWSGKAR